MVRALHLTVLVTVLFAGAMMIAGCTKPITAKTVREDISPNLETMAKTHEQRLNNQARLVDYNLRQMNDDVDSLLLINRPSLLTRYPVP